MKLPQSSSKVEAYTSSQSGQAPLVLPIVAYGKGDVNGGRCMIIYNKIRRKIHEQIFLLPSSFPLYLKNYIHALLMVNRFVESIITYVPISLFHGLAAKAASPVLLATPAGVISRLRRSMSFASQMSRSANAHTSTSKLAPV